MGGAGSNRAFCANVRALAMFPEPEMVFERAEFFGFPVAGPFFPAPVTGAEENFGGYLSNYEYAFMVGKAAKDCGVICFFGDGFEDEKFLSGIHAAIQLGIRACFIIKPWADHEKIMLRIMVAERSGALAVGCDVDSVSLPTMTRKNASMSKKTPSDLAAMIRMTKLPFIVKGIMTDVQADQAITAGAAGIVVSNHGGRVDDDLPAVIDVLPGIAERFGKKTVIIADGGVRDNAGYRRMLSAGAHFVMAGRPMVHGAMLRGSAGVAERIRMICNR